MRNAAPDARFTAELIAFLTRFAVNAGHCCGLTSAQWTALRYFLRANRPSRTVSAFADFHNTTRGTASKTVQSLVEKKLLRRTRQQADRRVVRIDLTAEGDRLCQTDPFANLEQEIAKLPEVEQEKLKTILEMLTGRIAADRQKRIFGTCSTCRYIKKCLNSGDEDIRYFCRLTAEPLALPDMSQICMNYKSAVVQA